MVALPHTCHEAGMHELAEPLQSWQHSEVWRGMASVNCVEGGMLPGSLHRAGLGLAGLQWFTGRIITVCVRKLDSSAW